MVLFSSQALAELYVIDGQYEKAFSLYADVIGLPLYLFFNQFICYPLLE